MEPELLSRFLEAHPEYFEGSSEALSLRRDLRSIFEEYAQAMDPEEYEKLRRQVEAYRKKEKVRLQKEIENLVGERKKEETRLKDISADLEKLEREVNRLERHLEELVESQQKASTPMAKSWYNSGYTYLVLDFLGVLFLYTGIILRERLAMSYVLMGVSSIFLGFILQQRGAEGRRVPNPVLNNLKNDISHQWHEMRQISKIRRITLSNRKKATLNKIEDVNRKIETSLQKINEHNRE